MKNTRILLLLVVVFFHLDLFGQMLRPPFVAGYQYKSTRYFDSVSQTLDCERKLMTGNYHFYVTFKVDNNGKPLDIGFVEIPGSEAPQVVKNHIRSLINTTEGKWLSLQNLFKGEVVCSVLIVRKTITPWERMETSSKIMEYLFLEQNAKGSKLEELLNFRHKVLLCLEL